MKIASLGMALLVGMCLAVPIAGCGGNDGGGATDLTARDVSDEQLTLMVLPREELGANYAALELDEGISGFTTNEKLIAGSQDPDDERQDIQRFGRVNGYSETYSSTGAFLTGQGVLHVATAAELLRDSVGASGRLHDEIADYETETRTQAEEEGEGQEADLRPFTPGDIGEEALGLEIHMTIPADGDLKLSYSATYIAFRRGRLAAAVVVGELGGNDRREEVAALARKLDERIQAVLRGDITPIPAATP